MYVKVTCRSVSFYYKHGWLSLVWYYALERYRYYAVYYVLSMYGGHQVSGLFPVEEVSQQTDSSFFRDARSGRRCGAERETRGRY